MLKSARQISLTIIVLTGIAVQLGWFERERTERHAVYSYIEKVLVLSEIFQNSLSKAQVSLVSLTAQTPPIVILAAGTDNPAAIFVRSMSDEKFSEVAFGADSDQLKTLGDPGGDCTIRIFRGNGDGVHGIEKINALSTEQRFSEVKTPLNSKSYLVLFGRACLYSIGDIEPVLVVYDPQDPEFATPSMVISERIASATGLPLDTTSDRENELFFFADTYPKAILDTLGDLDDLTRPAYTESVLRAAVVREAMSIGGSPYNLEDWRDAISKIYERSARAPSIFGFNLPSEIAAFSLPLVLTAVVFSFIFRVRRIEDLGDDEVWVLTHSTSLFEHLGAAIWFLVLLSAPTATMWGLSAYAPDQVNSMFTSLQVATFQLDPSGTDTREFHATQLATSSAFWALIATVFSTAMMTFAIALLTRLRITSARKASRAKRRKVSIYTLRRRTRKR